MLFHYEQAYPLHINSIIVIPRVKWNTLTFSNFEIKKPFPQSTVSRRSDSSSEDDPSRSHIINNIYSTISTTDFSRNSGELWSYNFIWKAMRKNLTCRFPWDPFCPTFSQFSTKDNMQQYWTLTAFYFES